MFRKTIGPTLALCVLAACSDANVPGPVSPTVSQNQSEGKGFAQRLYAIGTSISAGTCSDGNVAACQNSSWVAQLIRALHREPTLPLISEPGCKAPFASPLIRFARTSGEPINVSDATAICSPNDPAVVLPTQNLAVPGALTINALNTRPEDITDPFGSRLYRRILPLGESQVSALDHLDVKFATVELGANDILGIRNGLVKPGVTFVPFSFWAPQYNTVLDRVGAATKQALIVGLGVEVSSFPAFRRGSELWADRAAFLSAFNVDVSADCDGSQNLLLVPVIVVSAVGNGLGLRQAGAGPFPLSCAGDPSAEVEDRVLTPAEQAVVNAQLVQMSDHIRGQAAARGYAFFELEVLYGLPKPPFSVVTLMTSGTPYGPNYSLDGLHPSAAGHAIIAQAAVRAIDDRYKIGLSGATYGISTSPSTRSP